MKKQELLAQLFIISIAAFGLMRAFEWISRGKGELKNASDIYVELNKYLDIQTTGWLLLISSIILLAAVFTRGRTTDLLLIIGGLIFGIIQLVYAAIAANDALLLETVYRANLLGVFGIIIVVIGGISLWRTRKKK